MGLLTIMGGSARGTTLKRERARGGRTVYCSGLYYYCPDCIVNEKKKKEKKN